MPKRRNQSQAQARGRRREIMAALSRSPAAPGPGVKPAMPPRTPPGIPANPAKPAPTGAPVPKDVRAMAGQGPPRSTLPREGTLGYQYGDKALVDRLQKQPGARQLGAYNLTHKHGDPIKALMRRRRRSKKGRKGEQFGGPSDGRAVAE